MPDVYNRIDNGDYKPNTTYPIKPVRPVILLRKVMDLTDGEIASIGQIKSDYEQSMVVYRAQLEHWNSEVRRLENQFRQDLEEETGMKGHPKADALWGKAWKNGCGGMSEVYSVYNDLLDLVQ